MAIIGDLRVTPPDTGPMLASIESVFDAIAASHHLAQTFAHYFPSAFIQSSGIVVKIDDDGLKLFRRLAVDMPTCGAGQVHSFQFKPSARYLEAVDALAAVGGQVTVTFSDDWPILSLAAFNLAETEAGGAASAPGGGAVEPPLTEAPMTEARVRLIVREEMRNASNRGLGR